MLTTFPPSINTRIFSFFNVTFVTFIKQPYIQRIASDKIVTKVTSKIKTHVRARENLILLIGIFCRYLKNLYLCIGYL